MVGMPDIGATVGAWNALVRRARIGRERKAAAMVVSSYASSDGTGIHCGVARLAVDLEIGYSTARRYLAWLRTVGLIELVRTGSQRRGLSDEYRLVLGPDVMEHLDVPDPDRYDKLRNEIRDANRAASAKRSRRIAENLRSQETSAEVDDQRSSRASAETGGSDHRSALAKQSAETIDLRSLRRSSALTLDEPPPSLYTSPKEHTSPKPTVEELRSDLTVVGREQDLDFSTESPDRDPDLRSPLRLIEGQGATEQIGTGTRGLFPVPVPDEPPKAARRGHGWCVPCHTAGKTTLAADPVAGDICAHHLATRTAS